MSIFLRLAWRNLWRQPRRTWLTVGAMVFSNTLLVFLISVQLSFYDLLIDNMLGTFTGHLQVQHADYKDEQKIRQVVPQVRGVAEALRSGLGIETVAARAETFALTASEDRTYGARIVGVDPAFEPLVSSLPGLIAEGRYLSDPDAPELVIGSTLVRNLKAGLGDDLTIIGSGRDGSFAAAVMKIVGIFESGSDDLDRTLVEMPLVSFQSVFAMQDAGHAVAIRVPELSSVESAAATAGALIPNGQDLVIHDWDALLPGLRQSIQADMASGWFMFGVLVIIVSFSVLNTQLMSVLERTREFGIVMSLGATPGRLGRLVIAETAFLGLLGLTIGVAAGALLTGWFSAHGFTFPGMDEMAGRFNLPSRVYPRLSLISLFAGPLVVFAGSLLAAFYPAARMQWLHPVQAMRAA